MKISLERAILFTLFAMGICLISSQAEDLYFEQLRTVDGRQYQNVLVKKIEPDGILISHTGGVGKIKFTELPQAIADRFGYNPEKARAFEIAEKEKQQAIRQEIDEINSVSAADARVSEEEHRKKIRAVQAKAYQSQKRLNQPSTPTRRTSKSSERSSKGLTPLQQQYLTKILRSNTARLDDQIKRINNLGNGIFSDPSEIPDVQDEASKLEEILERRGGNFGVQPDGGGGFAAMNLNTGERYAISVNKDGSYSMISLGK